MAQSAVRVAADNFLIVWDQIVGIFTSKRFWAIIVTLAGAAAIGWMLLHSATGFQSILLPNAEQVIIVNNLPYHTVQSNNYALFLKQEYKIVLAGRLDNMLMLVGITDDGSAYFYKQKIAPKPALFSTIKNMYQEDNVLRVETGRDWETRIVLSLFTAFIVLLIVVYFILELDGLD